MPMSFAILWSYVCVKSAVLLKLALRQWRKLHGIIQRLLMHVCSWKRLGWTELHYSVQYQLRHVHNR